jgi:hypothetical protein
MRAGAPSGGGGAPPLQLNPILGLARGGPDGALARPRLKSLIAFILPVLLPAIKDYLWWVNISVVVECIKSVVYLLDNV